MDEASTVSEFFYAECRCGEIRRSPVIGGDRDTAGKWLRFKMWKHMIEAHNG